MIEYINSSRRPTHLFRMRRLHSPLLAGRMIQRGDHHLDWVTFRVLICSRRQTAQHISRFGEQQYDPTPLDWPHRCLRTTQPAPGTKRVPHAARADCAAPHKTVRVRHGSTPSAGQGTSANCCGNRWRDQLGLPARRGRDWSRGRWPLGRTDCEVQRLPWPAAVSPHRTRRCSGWVRRRTPRPR